MKYVKLGNSNLNVSRVCMGCMGFGDPQNGMHTWTLPEKESVEIINNGLDNGINFYDNIVMKLSERLIDMVVYNDEEIKGFLQNNDYSDITIYLRDGKNKQEIIKMMDGSETRIDDDYDNVSFSDKFLEWMTIVAKK